MDEMMIGELITATTAAVELAKALNSGIEKYEDAEIKHQLADLISTLADAKLESAAAAEKIAELEGQLKLLAEMKYDGEMYWRQDGDEMEGPFCQRCFDAEHLAIRLQKRGVGGYHCRQCKSHYGTADGQPRQEAKVRSRKF